MQDGPPRPPRSWGRRRAPGIRAGPIPMSTASKFLLGALALAIVAAGSGVVVNAIRGSHATAPKDTAAVPVTAARVVARTVPVRLTAIGNVEPFTSVAVKARVDGEIVSVAFREGDEVRQGALLFE